MYNVQILSDKEFESLPYPEMETSLGVADPRNRTAYVRYTQSEELNKYLVNHELEHLIDGHGGTHSNHYRNGVYYKGFGDLFSPLLGMVSSFLSPKQQAQPQSQPQSYSQQQAPVTSFPSQQGAGGSPSVGGSPIGAGPSGGTGALGSGLTGSPVDKLRGALQTGNQGSFAKGNYGLRGAI